MTLHKYQKSVDLIFFFIYIIVNSSNFEENRKNRSISSSASDLIRIKLAWFIKKKTLKNLRPINTDSCYLFRTITN